jgi:flagellar protein FliO/FliZ
VSLSSRLTAAAYAAATTCLLAPATVLAAAADKDKEPVPAQPSYGENTRLDLDEGTRQVADPTGSSTGGSLVRTFVGLAVVIAVIYGLYWVLKQVKSSREERVSGAGLSSAAVVPLGPNRSLHLVRAGRELVLLGVAEHGVTPIRRYTEAEAHELGIIVPNETPTSQTSTAAVVDPTRPAGAGGALTIGQLIEKLREKTVRR